MNEANNNSPRVSIALATYNGAEYLSQLLESIKQQTLFPFEVIVCDDGSQDETLDVLNRYKLHLPLTILSNIKPIGVVQNFQKIVSLCVGDYIAFCDQDDVWLPHKLEQSVEEIKKIDGSLPAMVFTDLMVVNQDLDLIADSYWRHRRLLPQKETFASLIYGNIVTGCTMVINRPMAMEVAHMPTTVLMHDFWISCVAYAIGRYSYLEAPTILYRQHSTNVTNNDAITWTTRLKRNLSFFLEDDNAKLYLMPQIKQAQLFANLYMNKLSKSDRDAINQLFKLESRKPIVRKWRTFLIKMLHIIPNK